MLLQTATHAARQPVYSQPQPAASVVSMVCAIHVLALVHETTRGVHYDATSSGSVQQRLGASTLSRVCWRIPLALAHRDENGQACNLQACNACTISADDARPSQPVPTVKLIKQLGPCRWFDVANNECFVEVFLFCIVSLSWSDFPRLYRQGPTRHRLQ